MGYLTQNWNLASSETKALKRVANYSEFAQVRNELIEQYYNGRQLTNSSVTKSEQPPTNVWPER